MNIADTATIIGALVGIVTVILALVGSISTQSKNLRDIIKAGDAEGKAYSDTKFEFASKLRHDLKSEFSTLLVSVDKDVETLKREAVRRDDLNALESRWAAMFTRVESKIDRQSEQLADMSALKATLAACVTQLEHLVKRMDRRDEERRA